MFTWDELRKAARLRLAYGDLRPGYMEHDAGNITGPHRKPRVGKLPLFKKDVPGANGSITFEHDEATGEAVFKVQ
jgi:hypothetical protein